MIEESLREYLLESGIQSENKIPFSVAMSFALDYARLQIEKDRERVKARIRADDYWVNQIEDLPIQLD